MAFTHYRVFLTELGAKRALRNIETAKGLPNKTTLRWSDIFETDDGRFAIASADTNGVPKENVKTREEDADEANDPVEFKRLELLRLARRDRQDPIKLISKT